MTCYRRTIAQHDDRAGEGVQCVCCGGELSPHSPACGETRSLCIETRDFVTMPVPRFTSHANAMGAKVLNDLGSKSSPIARMNELLRLWPEFKMPRVFCCRARPSS